MAARVNSYQNRLQNRFIFIIILAVFFSNRTQAERRSFKDASLATGYAAYVILPNTAGSTLRPYSAVVSALSKLVEGNEKEAIEDLKMAVNTLVGGYLSEHSLYMMNHEAIDSVVYRKEFQRTREAVKNYNEALWFQLHKIPDSISKEETTQHAKKALVFVYTEFKNELSKISEKSNIVSSFKKLNMWSKNKDLSQAMPFAFHIISLRVSIDSLSKALDGKDSKGIAAACIGISISIVGIGSFVAAIDSEISISGTTGITAGSVLHVCTTLLEITLNSHPTDDKAVEFETLPEIKTIREQSKKQLRLLMLFLNNQQLGLNDIYAINQGVFPKWGILYKEDWGALAFGEVLNISSIDSPIFRKEDSSDILLTAGRSRRILMPSENEQNTQLEIIGFDFYGAYKKGYPYRGSTIFINSNFVKRSDYRLSGLKINTGINKQWYHPNDQVTITDLPNLDEGEKIEINLGKGDDVLIINGVLGNLTEKFRDVLHADLGTGLNALSFEGMNATRGDFKGISFNSKDNTVSYIHDNGSSLHKAGVVENVRVLIGSQLDDYIVLSGNEKNDPNYFEFLVVQNSGQNYYEVNLDEMSLVKKKRLKIIDNSDKPPSVIIRASFGIKRNELIFVGNTLKIYTKKKDEVNEVKEPMIWITFASRNVALVKVIDRDNKILLKDVPTNQLGTMFVTGSSLFANKQHLVNGTDQDDICVLDCSIRSKHNKRRIRVVDLGKGEDIIVIKDSTFIGKCKINSYDHRITLSPVERVGDDETDNESWHLTVQKKVESEKNVLVKFLIRNVERIVNAFGSTIVDLSNEKKEQLELLPQYIAVTAHDIGLRSDSR